MKTLQYKGYLTDNKIKDFLKLYKLSTEDDITSIRKFIVDKHNASSFMVAHEGTLKLEDLCAYDARIELYRYMAQAFEDLMEEFEITADMDILEEGEEV